MPFQVSMKAARVNAEKTQAEAAAFIGVSKATIVNWEAGRRMPKVDQLRKLCEYYGCPMDNIFLR